MLDPCLKVNGDQVKYHEGVEAKIISIYTCPPMLLCVTVSWQRNIKHSNTMCGTHAFFVNDLHILHWRTDTTLLCNIKHNHDIDDDSKADDEVTNTNSPSMTCV